jgi:hypothetical protein
MLKAGVGRGFNDIILKKGGLAKFLQVMMKCPDGEAPARHFRDRAVR